jgi:hypothetical protein
MSREWSVVAVIRRLSAPEGLADPYRIYREIRMDIVPRLFDRFGPMGLAAETTQWQSTLDLRGPSRLLVRR